MLCSDGVSTDYSFVYRCPCSQIVSDSEFEISEPCSNYQRVHYTLAQVALRKLGIRPWLATILEV